MNKEEPATDWLFNQLWEIPKDRLEWNKLREQAKIKFQKQVTNACYEGMQSGFDANYGRAEMYYKEKYENL